MELVDSESLQNELTNDESGTKLLPAMITFDDADYDKTMSYLSNLSGTYPDEADSDQNKSEELQKSLTYIFGKIDDLLGREFYDGANLALKAIPESIQLNSQNRFTIARTHYEAGNYLQAQASLEQIPEEAPQHQALKMAVLCGLSDWDGLTKLLNNHFDASGNMDWVVDRIFGNIHALVDREAYDDALSGVQAIEGVLTVPERHQFTLARACYETGHYVKAKSVLDQMSLGEPKHYALQMAVLAGLHDWPSLQTTLQTQYDASGDMAWVLQRIYGEVETLVAQEAYSQALSAINAIPDSVDIPQTLNFTLARLYYEASEFSKAQPILDELMAEDATDPKYQALNMAVLTGLYDWHGLQTAMQSQYNTSGDMAWVVNRIYGEIETLVDGNAYSQALSAVNAIPDSVAIPQKLRFTLARVFYETGAFSKAQPILDGLMSIDAGEPKYQALNMAVLSGLHDWHGLQSAMKTQYNASGDMAWVLDRIYSEIEALVDEEVYSQALWAVNAIPESVAIPQNLHFTLARIYYETGELSKAQSILDGLISKDAGEPKYQALNMAVLAGLHDWHRLQTVMQSQYDSSRELDWVINRIYGEISSLLDLEAYSEASSAIEVVPDSFVIPAALQFMVARVYYETDELLKAKPLIHGLIKVDAREPKYHALYMAVLAGSHDWAGLKPTMETQYDSSKDMDWVIARIFDEIELLVDQTNYSEALSAVKVLPNNVEFPDSLKFILARVYYEVGDFTKAQAIIHDLKQKTGDDPKYHALQMAAMAGLQDWTSLQILMRNHYEPSGDMDWVLGRVYGQIDALVDQQDYSEAVAAIGVIPKIVTVPKKLQFIAARVHYEAGEYETARTILDRLSLSEPQNNALRMAVLAGLHDWEGLEKSVHAKYDPSGEMDWVLERVFGEISKIESADFRQTAIRLEKLLIDNFFEHSPYEIKMRLLAALTQAGQYDLVLDLAVNLKEAKPENFTLLVIMARAAYLRRKWDSDIEVFQEFMEKSATSHYMHPKVSAALEAIAMIEESSLLTPEQVDGRINDRLFDVFFRANSSKPYEASAPNKVALIGANMAAGGAEHVLVNAHLGLLENKSVDNSLWLHNIDEHLNHDHFLRQYDVELGGKSKTYLMKPIFETTKPFSYIEGYIGYQSNKVYRQIMEEKPAVIHAWQDSTNIECAFAGIEAGVPKIILHPHNMRPDLVHKTKIAKSFWACYRALLSRDDTHLICCSQASLNDYLGWLDIAETDNCHVVYNGFKWSEESLETQRKFSRKFLSEKLSIDPGLKIVCGIFRLNEVKQPLLWAEIARLVSEKREDVAFVIFGDGELRPELKEFITKHDLGDRFFLPGRVQNATKHSADCNVLLQTSRTEGLPTVLIEAMTNGMPVVASNVGGSNECFAGNHPEMFQLIDGFNPEDFAVELIRMLDCEFEDEQKQELSDGTKQKFGIDAMVGALKNIYS